MWLPDYIRQMANKGGQSLDSPIHIMFIFVDHYEPGRGIKGVEKNRQWLKDYMEMANRHRDSYGRKPQHTWFYPYDHKNGEVVEDLAKAVYHGYGEIEFHWHHGNDTNETFPGKLSDALLWFNSYGAMKTIGNGNPVAFGFIHGNWALDNSGKKEHCGVSRELDILKRAGCYADFTFPSFGSVSQPSKINSIYYAIDDDDPKSYDRGENAEVGRRNRVGLMIFEGPLGLSLSRQMVECGAVETDYMPSPSRVDKWIETGISVKGRPAWIFVKVYTHGIQGRNVFFSKETDEMFTYLEQKYTKDPYQLHYITAREAYNIVRAAEDDLSGDPDLYRNYVVKEPLNKYILTDVPVRYDKVCESEILFTPMGHRNAAYLLRLSPILKIDGTLNYFHYKLTEDGDRLQIIGKEILKIYSKKPLMLFPKSSFEKKDNQFIYELHFDE